MARIGAPIIRRTPVARRTRRRRSTRTRAMFPANPAEARPSPLADRAGRKRQRRRIRRYQSYRAAGALLARQRATQAAIQALQNQDNGIFGTGIGPDIGSIDIGEGPIDDIASKLVKPIASLDIPRPDFGIADIDSDPTDDSTRVDVAPIDVIPGLGAAGAAARRGGGILAKLAARGAGAAPSVREARQAAARAMAARSPRQQADDDLINLASRSRRPEVRQAGRNARGRETPRTALDLPPSYRQGAYGPLTKKDARALAARESAEEIARRQYLERVARQASRSQRLGARLASRRASRRGLGRTVLRKGPRGATRPGAVTGTVLGTGAGGAALSVGGPTFIAAGGNQAEIQRGATLPVEIGRAVVEDPKQVGSASATGLFETLVGLPAFAAHSAAATGALAKGDTGPANELIGMIVEDYKHRYGPLLDPNIVDPETGLTGAELFRERLKEHGGVTPFALDALIYTPTVGRVLGKTAEAGRLGPAAQRLMAQDRPHTMLAAGNRPEGDAGALGQVSQPRRTSPSLFGAAVQKKIADRFARKRTAKRAGTDPFAERAQAQGMVVKKRQARHLKLDVGGAKSRARYSMLSRQGHEIFKGILKEARLLNDQEKSGVYEAVAFGVRTPDQARYIIGARIEQIIAARQGGTEIPGSWDELPELFRLLDEADEVFTPNLGKFADTQRARGERLAQLDPSITPEIASMRQFKPLAHLFGVEGTQFRLKVGEKGRDEFMAAFQKARKEGRGVYLSPKTVKELEQMDLYLDDSGNVGVGVFTAKDGVREVHSLFNDSEAAYPGAGIDILKIAERSGATRLDAIGDGLRAKYERAGWKVTETLPWNDKYAPDGWDYEKGGRPNVYIMEKRFQPRKEADRRKTEGESPTGAERRRLERRAEAERIVGENLQTQANLQEVARTGKIPQGGRSRAMAAEAKAKRMKGGAPETGEGAHFVAGNTVPLRVHGKTYNAKVVKVTKGRLLVRYTTKNGKTKEVWRDKGDIAAGIEARKPREKPPEKAAKTQQEEAAKALVAAEKRRKDYTGNDPAVRKAREAHVEAARQHLEDVTVKAETKAKADAVAQVRQEVKEAGSVEEAVRRHEARVAGKTWENVTADDITFGDTIRVGDKTLKIRSVMGQKGDKSITLLYENGGQRRLPRDTPLQRLSRVTDRPEFDEVQGELRPVHEIKVGDQFYVNNKIGYRNVIGRGRAGNSIRIEWEGGGEGRNAKLVDERKKVKMKDAQKVAAYKAALERGESGRRSVAEIIEKPRAEPEPHKLGQTGKVDYDAEVQSYLDDWARAGRPAVPIGETLKRAYKTAEEIHKRDWLVPNYRRIDDADSSIITYETRNGYTRKKDAEADAIKQATAAREKLGQNADQHDSARPSIRRDPEKGGTPRWYARVRIPRKADPGLPKHTAGKEVTRDPHPAFKDPEKGPTPETAVDRELSEGAQPGTTKIPASAEPWDADTFASGPKSNPYGDKSTEAVRTELDRVNEQIRRRSDSSKGDLLRQRDALEQELSERTPAKPPPTAGDKTPDEGPKGPDAEPRNVDEAFEQGPYPGETDAEFMARVLYLADRRIKDPKAALAKPGYAPESIHRGPKFSSYATGGTMAVAKAKQNRSVLRDLGIVDRRIQAMADGYAQNIKRAYNWNLVADIFERHTIPASRGKSMFELLKMVEGKDPQSYVFVNTGRYRKIQSARSEDENLNFADEITPESIGEAGAGRVASGISDQLEEIVDEPIITAIDNAVLTPEQARQLGQLSDDPTDFLQQQGWAIMPRAVYDEIRSGAQGSLFGRLMGIAVTKQSRLLLGSLNLPWLQFQVMSNAFLTALAGTGPFDIAKSIAWWKSLSPEEREAIEPYIGVGSFRGEVEQPRLGAYSQNQWVNSWRAMKETVGGKLIWGKKRGPRVQVRDLNPLDAMFRVDQAQNNLFRRAIFYSQIKKGAWERMGRNMNDIGQLHNRIIGGFTKGPEEQMRAMIRNIDDVEAAGAKVQEFLGDYMNFTHTERNFLKRNVMFYSYLRFATRFAFYTLPIKHPIMAGIMGQLSRMQAEEVRELMGGYSLPFALGRYYFKDGSMMVDLTRANPVMSALSQSLGAATATGKLFSVTGLLPPMYAAAMGQILNLDAFTGKSQLTEGVSQPKLTLGLSVEERARIATADFLNLMYPYREWAEIEARGQQQGADSLAFSPRYIEYADPEIRKEQRQRAKELPDALLEQLRLAVFPFAPKPTHDVEIASALKEKRKEEVKARYGRSQAESAPSTTNWFGEGGASGAAGRDPSNWYGR